MTSVAVDESSSASAAAAAAAAMAVDDPHRSSFVKFVEDSDGDDEKETPFVRHNTPHPKDLKAKAQKHFKGKKIDGKVVQHDEHVIIPFFFYLKSFKITSNKTTALVRS